MTIKSALLVISETYESFEVAESESTVPAKLDHMLDHLDAYRRASDESSVAHALIDAIREFVNS